MAAAIPNRTQFRKDKCYVDKVWDKCHDFLDNERYIDVTFLWRSSRKRVTAHRLILGASSAFFDELFQTSRGMAPAIYIEDIEAEHFELLIAYCYSGKLYPRKHNVTELLNAATILQLDGAAAICAAHLRGETKTPRADNTTALGRLKPTARTINPNSSSDAYSLAPTCSVPQSHSLRLKIKNALKMDAGNTNSFSLLPQALATAGSRVLNSILAVRTCDLQKDNESFIYRCDGPKQKWLQYGVLTIPRKYSDFAYLCNSLISVGGFDNGRPTNSVDSYNLKTQTWQPLPDMQTPRSELCVTTINEVIYAMGGRDDDSKALNTVEKLHLNKSSAWVTLPPMLTPRRKATAVAAGELIYVLGGLGIDWQPLKSVECYNTKTSKWTRCADMRVARHDCGATLWNGHIIAIGSGNLPPYSCEVECYSLQTDFWTKLVSLTAARSGICGVTFCGQVLAVGGFLPNYYKGIVEIYSQKQNAWLTAAALPAGGNYKCFIVPTEELVDIEKARKPSISLTAA